MVGGEQDDPCIVLWDYGSMDSLSQSSGSLELRLGWLITLQESCPRLWDDFTPLKDENADDRRYRHNNISWSALYCGQRRVPELHGAQRKSWLIKPRLKLGNATKTCMLDMLHNLNLDWEVMETEVDRVVDTCNDCQRGQAARATCQC